MQDFRAVVNYFTMDEWRRFESMSREACLSSLMERCFALGMLCPSEHTLKLLTSVFLAITEDSTSGSHGALILAARAVATMTRTEHRS